MTKSQSSNRFRPATVRDKLTFLYLCIPIVIVDQLTKWWVEDTMPLYSRRIFDAVDPYFKFTHIPNHGAAFGMFQNGSLVITILAFVVAIGLVVFNWQLPFPSPKLRIALGIVMAGAVGNLIDRLRIGHVTDFIDLDVSSIINVPLADWPIFNVADMAVTTGVIIMLYLTLFDPEEIEGPKTGTVPSNE